MTDLSLEPVSIADADPLDLLMLSTINQTETPCLDMTAYIELVKELPSPTDAQMQAFAKYLSEARSWYKHLPLRPPGRRFYFYLHPDAGRARVLLASGRTLMVERTSDTSSCHYSSMTSEMYREQFGYLAFSGPSNTGVFTTVVVDGKEGMLDCNPALPVIQVSPDAARRPPQDVLAAGECQVTGLVHPYFQAFPFRQQRIIKRLSTVQLQSVDPTWAPIVERCQALAAVDLVGSTGFEESLDSDLTQLVARKRTEHLNAMVEAMQRACELVYG